ncbi:hypothetical protein D3C72_2039710 [compost metagenome]
MNDTFEGTVIDYKIVGDQLEATVVQGDQVVKQTYTVPVAKDNEFASVEYILTPSAPKRVLEAHQARRYLAHEEVSKIRDYVTKSLRNSEIEMTPGKKFDGVQ